MGKTLIADFAPQGLNLDIAPFALAPDSYTGMRNMRVSGQGVNRAEGVAQLAGTLLFVPKFAMTAIFNNEVWLVYMGAGGVGVTNGTSHYNVTPSTGWADFQSGTMTGGLMNGYPIFNAQNRAPWYWNGTLAVGGVKPLPGFLTNTLARCVAPFGSHIFAGSLSDASIRLERLAWSDLAGPGTVPATWTPTATNQAGEIDLSTGGGQINNMRGLGAQLMVYRVTGAYAVQYVGRPYIYTARKLSADVGAASSNSVAEVRGAHCILSPGDLVMGDGTTLRSIGEARVKASLFSQISEAGLRLSHVYSTPGRGEVVFCLALGQDVACNVAYVWNYEADKWSIRDLPDCTHSFSTYVPTLVTPSTWDSDAGIWETDYKAWDAGPQGGFKPRACGVSEVNGKAWLLDEGDLLYDGSNIPGEVERVGLALGNPATVKLISRVYPRINGEAGAVVNVQVGAQVGPGDLVNWGPPVPFTIGTTKHVDCLASGRYAALRVSGAPLSSWGVAGFSMQYQERARS